MASTYVNNLRLNEMATGDASGTWGTITNTNLELIGEALGFGTEAITTNADTHTTTVADGASDGGRAMYLKYTGTLDSACTITIAPNTMKRMQFIENGTSGSQNIIISQGSGANITIPPGDTKAVYLDGAGSGAAVVDAFASLNVVDLKVEDDLTVTDDLIVNGDIDLEGSIDVNGTANLDIVDVDGAVNFAADVTFADGADIITASAGTSNFRAGVNAGNSIASGGNYNVVIGDEAGTAITTGDQNTFVGYASGDAVTTSSDNTAVGKSSMSAMIDGASNTAVGLSALSDDTKGSKSTGIGYQALSTQNFTSATDSNNTAVGYNAGSLITTGIFNTIMGGLAGDALSDADYNVALGGNSLSTDTLGHQSVAVGYGALNSQNFTSSTNSLNTAVGYRAGTSLTTGTQNTAVGNNALTGVVTGTGNVVMGNESGNSITSGAYNTLIGRYSADSLTTGAYNTHLGNDTDVSAADIQFGVAIGHGAVDKGTNTGMIAPTSGVYQGNNNASWSTTSDERIKKNIVDNNIGLDTINKIQV